MIQRRVGHRRAVRVLAAGASGAVVAALIAVPASAHGTAGGGSTVLAKSKPGWAAAAADKGKVSTKAPVDFDIVLSLRNATAAQAQLKAVSTPGSAAYRSFLSTTGFRSAYAPTAASVAAVEKWAKHGGLKIQSVASSNMYVEVAGSVASAQKLLKTTLHTYAYKGQDLESPSTDLTIPTALVGVVAGVAGLDQTLAISQRTVDGGSPASTTAATATPAVSKSGLPGPPPGARYGTEPCSAYYGQKIATTLPGAYGAKVPYTICGYNAKQYESAFGYSAPIAAGNDGSGVTVAITDAYASPTMLSDAQTWSSQNGIPTFTVGQYSEVLPKGFDLVKACGGSGWYGEETLDVESVHAMAPGAKVVYVGGKNCAGGLNNAFASVIDNHLASVVTDSWLEGAPDFVLPTGLIAFYHEYLLEAGLTGVSALFSSGDTGDNVHSAGLRFTSLPASDSYATAVGGTSTEIGANGKIALQTGWSNAYAALSADGKSWTPNPPGNYSSGAGGGISGTYAEPFYQVGVVPAVMASYGTGNVKMRTVPDISMPADPNTGLRIGETQRFPDGTYYDTYRLGGTSLASPLLAGVLADTIQAVGSPLGFINPAIYGTYSTTAAVTDVLSVKHIATVRTDFANFLDSSDGYLYRLPTLDIATTIHTAVGYDDITGLGTPDGVKFYSAFAQ